MRAKTRIFGEIDIPQDKIITMEKGMIGFSELKNYTLIYNSSGAEELRCDKRCGEGE